MEVDPSQETPPHLSNYPTRPYIWQSHLSGLPPSISSALQRHEPDPPLYDGPGHGSSAHEYLSTPISDSNQASLGSENRSSAEQNVRAWLNDPASTFVPLRNRHATLPQDPLDTAFRVSKHPQKFFTVGRVFRVVWSEPAGAEPARPTRSDALDGWISRGPYEQPIFSKVRHLVVVRQSGSYCNAVSINTYHGQGVVKDSVEKWEHSIVYTGKEPPDQTKFEQLRFGDFQRPIRVNPDEKEDKLHRLSRLDFGRVRTVDFNTRVKPFGMVHPQSTSDLVAGFLKVMLGSSSGPGGGLSLTALLPSGDDSQTQISTELIENTATGTAGVGGQFNAGSAQSSADSKSANEMDWAVTHTHLGAHDFQSMSSDRDTQDIRRAPGRVALVPNSETHSTNLNYSPIAALNSDDASPLNFVDLYACQVEGCEKSFRTRSDRNHHQRIHIREEQAPLPCPECSSRFSYLGDLRRHREAKHERIQLKCAFCIKTFVRKDNLQRHIKKVHQDHTTSSPGVDMKTPPLSRSDESGSRFDRPEFPPLPASQQAQPPSR